MATIVIKDKNLVPQNIKKGVTILKVTGTLESGGGVNNQDKTVNSSTVSQRVTSDSGYTGLGTVTVNPYVLDSKTVDPSTVSQTVNSSADGLSSVTVNAVTASIDPDILSGNIKKDVEILGVTGTFEGGTLSSKTVNSSTISQTVIPDQSDYGLSSVTVNPYIVESKSATLTANGQYTYTADNADALSQVTIDVSIKTAPDLQAKTVDSSISSQIVQADSSYDGLSQVTVNPYTLDSKTVDASTVSQTVTSDADGLSSVTVNPYTLDSKTVDASTVSQTVTSDEDGLSSVTVNPYILDSKTVNSSTSEQVITSDADGLSSVTVNPYTLDSKTIDSSTVSQTVTSDEDGLSSVTVNPYVLDSKTVDASTVSQTVTSDEDGLSSVTVNPYILDSKTVDSSTVQHVVISDEDGLSSVTINPYTVEADSSTLTANGQYVFTPTNADALSSVTVDVSVQGQIINNQNITVNPSINSQSVSASVGYTGLGTVTINAVDASIDTNIQASNIKDGITILGVTGTYESIPVLQDVSLNYTQNGTYSINASSGYDGLGVIDISINVASSGGGDWLADTLNGTITDPSVYILYQPTKEMQYAYLFYKYNITSTPDLSGWTSISGESALSYAFANTKITSLNLSNVTSISGTTVMDHAFSSCTNLTTVDLRSLVTCNAAYGFGWCFTGCSSLSTVYLNSLGSTFSTNMYNGIFSGCSALKTVYIGSGALNGQWVHNAILMDVGSIENLYVTNNITNDIYLIWQPNLTADSVLNVLNHLDLTVTGKSVNFYSSGLTVQDDAQGSIQTAHDAAVSAGWTINNLTITQA